VSLRVSYLILANYSANQNILTIIANGYSICQRQCRYTYGEHVRVLWDICHSYSVIVTLSALWSAETVDLILLISCIIAYCGKHAWLHLKLKPCRITSGGILVLKQIYSCINNKYPRPFSYTRSQIVLELLMWQQCSHLDRRLTYWSRDIFSICWTMSTFYFDVL
jgi:hypothetical protein